MVTPERIEEIRNRLASAKSAHPRNVLPEFGDLKAMEELLEEIDRLNDYIKFWYEWV